MLKRKTYVDPGWSHRDVVNPRTKLKVKVSSLEEAEETDTAYRLLDGRKALSLRKRNSLWKEGGAFVDWKRLEKTLHKYVGRPWSEVCSAVSEQTDTRTYFGNKVRNDLEDSLIHPTPCKIDENGFITTIDGTHSPSLSYTRVAFYVDEAWILREIKPTDNVQSKRSRRRYKTVRYFESDEAGLQSHVNKRSIKIGKNSFLIKCNRNWYVVETKDLSYLNSCPEDERLDKIIQLTTKVFPDVVLFPNAWDPCFAESIFRYRWVTRLTETYCKELRVGIYKEPAPKSLLNQYGISDLFAPTWQCDCGDPLCQHQWDEFAKKLSPAIAELLS